MAHVFVTRRITESGLQLLKDAGHQVTVSEKNGVLTRDELLHALSEEKYEALLCLLNNRIDATVFDAAPSLKIVANYAVGYDNIDLNAARARNITITNTPGVLTDAVAEHTIALVFALARRLSEADRFTRAGEFKSWDPLLLLGTQLRGAVLGLIGVGRIGSRVAQLASCMGMHIQYHDINRNEALEREHGALFKESLEPLLSQADIISLHVPLLDATRHLIGEKELTQMKPSALLINTARGPIVDEASLVTALQNGTIAGAALDVFEQEPKLSPGLIDLENVLLTPHIGSATNAARIAMGELAAKSIIDFFDGTTPQHVVQSVR